MDSIFPHPLPRLSSCVSPTCLSLPPVIALQMHTWPGRNVVLLFVCLLSESPHPPHTPFPISSLSPYICSLAFYPSPITPSHRTRFSTLRLFPAGHLCHVCSLFTPSPFNPLRSHPSRVLCICEIVHPNPPTTHLYHHMYLVSSLLCLLGSQPVCI